MKRRILGEEKLFDDITAITDVKYRSLSVNTRQVNLTEVSTSVYGKTRDVSHGMKIISAG